MSLSFLQLNIEGKKHIDRVLDFLLKNDLDAICFQEIYEDTLHMLGEKLGMNYSSFSEMCRKPESDLSFGIAILSKYPIKDTSNHILISRDARYRHGNVLNFVARKASIEKNNHTYKLITTHFPVNYPGTSISEFQMDCYRNLELLLKSESKFVLMGDFNSPRGTYIFDKLSSKYTDNIPKSITSTIDPILHRASPLQFVVDGVFNDEKVTVYDIKVFEGLSDHKGIMGKVKIN